MKNTIFGESRHLSKWLWKELYLWEHLKLSRQFVLWSPSSSSWSGQSLDDEDHDRDDESTNTEKFGVTQSLGVCCHQHHNQIPHHQHHNYHHHHHHHCRRQNSIIDDNCWKHKRAPCTKKNYSGWGEGEPETFAKRWGLTLPKKLSFTITIIAFFHYSPPSLSSIFTIINIHHHQHHPHHFHQHKHHHCLNGHVNHHHHHQYCLVQVPLLRVQPPGQESEERRGRVQSYLDINSERVHKAISKGAPKSRWRCHDNEDGDDDDKAISQGAPKLWCRMPSMTQRWKKREIWHRWIF